MKKSGFCTKCGSNRILGPKKIEEELGVKIRIGWKSAALKAYSCVDCGFTELYPDAKGLENLKEAYEKGDNIAIWE
ncbi:MAG TPA: hypothetical protein VMX55_14140 [candidate division Zixibacteria bacterium]|nr:hypothetical protein [candidate division Zixibacteria bacterium]